MVMKIFKEVENYELLKKYVPQYDGILFQVGGNAGRGICSSCGAIWPLKEFFTGSVCPNCGNHNFLNVTDQITQMCWSSNLTLDGQFGEKFDTVVNTPTGKQLVRQSLVLTTEERSKISFGESSSVVLEVNNKGILSSSYSLGVKTTDIKALGDYNLELEIYNVLDCAAWRGVIDLEQLNEYHKAMSNPDFPKLFREYSSLFKRLKSNDASYFMKFHTLHDICVEMDIPVDMEPYWMLYDNNYYGSDNQEDVVRSIKGYGEVGDKILRMVVREIINFRELVIFSHVIDYVDSLNGKKNLKMWSGYNQELVETGFNALSESMREYAISFMADNFHVYNTRVLNEFLARCKFLIDNGIIPTEDNLATKEYYCLVNKLSGLKPEFCDMVLEDPLAALKLL